MSALDRVARRIGIKPACELAYPDAWRDGENIVAVDGDLRTYLLTGDRPLRYFEALRKAGYRFVVRTLSDKVVILYVGPPQPGTLAAIHDSQFAEGATLDAAIIAIPEKIEGEGRE